jgi:NurA-like 5'-3' nuclease
MKHDDQPVERTEVVKEVDATSVCMKADVGSLNFRLEEALKERDEAREERDQARSDRDFIFRDNLRIEKERDEALVKVTWLVEQLNMKRADTTPDPSRLEIAARIIQGLAANSELDGMSDYWIKFACKLALSAADALIAAAKEVQP